MNILLIPSFNFIAGRAEPYVPYGLLNLQAVATEFPDCQVDIALPSLNFFEKRFYSSKDVVEFILEELDVSGYDVVGFSTVCNSFHYSLSLAALIKHQAPKIKIILGGPFVTKLSVEILKEFPFVDAIFVGEAEHSFRAFLENSKKRHALFFGIPGIRSRCSTFLSAAIVEDLDDLPFITHAHAFSRWLTIEKTLIPEKSFAPVEATRGCPLQCSFCSTKQVWGAKVRRKSASRLIEEMKAIQLVSGDHFFSLTGDNVGTPRGQFLRFCEEMASIQSGFTWACSLKLDRFIPEELELIWEAGCRGMFIGIETASQETLRRVNKAASVESEATNIRTAIKMGFQVETSFIIGFPWETPEDLRDTYELHCEFLKLGAKRSQVGVLSPIPGTEIVNDGKIDFEGASAYFSDDGICLSTEHLHLIHAYPDLFSHFGRYQTPYLSQVELNSYRNAAAQFSGLTLSQRHNLNDSVPFAGRSASAQ